MRHATRNQSFSSQQSTARSSNLFIMRKGRIIQPLFCVNFGELFKSIKFTLEIYFKYTYDTELQRYVIGFNSTQSNGCS